MARKELGLKTVRDKGRITLPQTARILADIGIDTEVWVLVDHERGEIILKRPGSPETYESGSDSLTSRELVPA